MSMLDFPFFDIAILFIVGVISGGINAVAGGGSFLSFPALVAVGLPPVIANATNTFASTGGYLSGAYALKAHLFSQPKKLIITGLVGVIGGTLGGVTLTQIDPSQFSRLIPWLMLIASTLFIWGETINRTLQRHRPNRSGLVMLAFTIFVVACYGGFFNAGLGIMLMAILVINSFTNIHEINAYKLYLSSVISLFAIAVFVVKGQIAWVEGGAVLVGSLLGTFGTATLAQQFNQTVIKRMVATISISITLYFFIIEYA